MPRNVQSRTSFDIFYKKEKKKENYLNRDMKSTWLCKSAIVPKL